MQNGEFNPFIIWLVYYLIILLKFWPSEIKELSARCWSHLHGCHEEGWDQILSFSNISYAGWDSLDYGPDISKPSLSYRIMHNQTPSYLPRNRTFEQTPEVHISEISRQSTFPDWSSHKFFSQYVPYKFGTLHRHNHRSKYIYDVQWRIKI